MDSSLPHTQCDILYIYDHNVHIIHMFNSAEDMLGFFLFFFYKIIFCVRP